MVHGAIKTIWGSCHHRDPVDINRVLANLRMGELFTSVFDHFRTHNDGGNRESYE